MARPRTRARVHDAVLALATESGYARLTMEGIAARAGVSKQTLYRSWTSTGAILFDALLARSTDERGRVMVPDSGNLARDLATIVAATVREISEPANDLLLRAVAAETLVDETLADQLRDQLLGPQLQAVAARLRGGGVEDPNHAVELLYGPIFYRWLLRLGAFDDSWVTNHIARTLRSLGVPGYDDPAPTGSRTG